MTARRHDEEMLSKGYLRIWVARALSDVTQTTIYRWVRENKVKSQKRGYATYVEIKSLGFLLDPTAKEEFAKKLELEYGPPFANLVQPPPQPSGGLPRAS